jgi:hypothetical protein
MVGEPDRRPQAAVWTDRGTPDQTRVHTSAVIKVELLLGILSLVLCIFCLVEAIGTPDGSVRNLPKVAWILLILFFPLIGSIAWLAAGRPEQARPRTRAEGAAPGFPEYDRPGRMAAADPEKDEEFLRQIRQRAEEQRRRYEAERRRQQGEPDPSAD